MIEGLTFHGALPRRAHLNRWTTRTMSRSKKSDNLASVVPAPSRLRSEKDSCLLELTSVIDPSVRSTNGGVSLATKGQESSVDNDQWDHSTGRSVDITAESLLSALKNTNPSKLTAEQKAQRRSHLMVVAAHLRRVYGRIPHEQKAADDHRSRPRNVFPKAITSASHLAPLYRKPDCLIPEQRVLGVGVTRPRGDGGGVVSSYLACRRSLTSADTERVWVGSLRDFADATAMTSLRRSERAGAQLDDYQQPTEIRVSRPTRSSAVTIATGKRDESEPSKVAWFKG